LDVEEMEGKRVLRGRRKARADRNSQQRGERERLREKTNKENKFAEHQGSKRGEKEVPCLYELQEEKDHNKRDMAGKSRGKRHGNYTVAKKRDLLNSLILMILQGRGIRKEVEIQKRPIREEGGEEKGSKKSERGTDIW